MAIPAMVMLDTNMVSTMLRGQHDATIMTHLRKIPPNRLCISTIVEAELRYGVARNPQAVRIAKDVAAFLSRMESLPWDSSAAEHYGALRAALEKAGTPLGHLDTLIAAHALSVGAVLITNDQALRQIKGLKTADWTQT